MLRALVYPALQLLLCAGASLALSDLALGFTLRPWRDWFFGLAFLVFVFLFWRAHQRSNSRPLVLFAGAVVLSWVLAQVIWSRFGLALPFEIISHLLEVDGESALDARGADLFLVFLSLGLAALVGFRVRSGISPSSPAGWR